MDDDDDVDELTCKGSTAPWQEEPPPDKSVRARAKAVVHLQRALVQITRLATPKARGSVHALGWLALAVNAFDIAHSSCFEVRDGARHLLVATAGLGEGGRGGEGGVDDG
jgi:hypothetical protein